MKSLIFVIVPVQVIPVCEVPLTAQDILNAPRHPRYMPMFRAHKYAQPLRLNLISCKRMWLVSASGFSRSELDVQSLFSAPCGWQWSLDNGFTWQRAVKYVDQHGDPVHIIQSN